jgi:NAD(P)-dependent dehydrogenase (short-subunit alcohol dehydrogenase family)
MGGFGMTNLFSLKGKTAIVTGGKNGLLGPIWVEILKNARAEVLPLDLPDFDITKDKIQSWLAKIGNYGPFKGLENLGEIEFDPKVDILVNNAAIDNPPDSKASFFGNFDKIMEVNIGGAVRMCEQVIPSMIKNGGGVIVNIGSIQGYGGADYRNYDEGFEKPFGYNASKWGLRGLAKSITVQYGRYGIRSVTISFGPYDAGKLSKKFLDKFLRNVPLNRTISKKSLQRTLLYACCCEELAGQDWRVDAGLGSWA